MKKETQCIHAGYVPGNGQPLAMPICQSTTFAYESTDYVGKIFDLAADGDMYSRISNPTVANVERKIAALEGGTGCVCLTSGQTASFLSIFNILSAGDHFVTTGKIYGGSTNLFAVTMKRMGISCTVVDQDDSEDEIQKAFQPNTKVFFTEMLANPALAVLDVEKMARIAHKNGVPLIVDNTFPTPILCRPFEFGADIVIHSTTKYMDGHAIQIGGAVIESGNFDWTNGKFPSLCTPDESYHGVNYVERFGKTAYTQKLRAQLVRDIGVCPPAISAFLLDLGLQTLAVRMRAHCENAMEVARFLSKNDKVGAVSYPGLENDEYHALAEKYLPNGCSGVISFTVKGGREAATRFMDSLTLCKNVVHVAAVYTCVLHPASETHRQLTDEQLHAAGINPAMIRLSVGIENVEDIIDDLKSAFEKI